MDVCHIQASILVGKRALHFKVGFLRGGLVLVIRFNVDNGGGLTAVIIFELVTSKMWQWDFNLTV